MNNSFPLIYATRHKDNKILMASSSGAMFIALGQYILDNNGVIACACYNYENKQTEYKLIFDREELMSASGSKYMQSYPNEIFNECKEWSLNNPTKKLMFIGMGCQSDAFRKYSEINNFRQNTFIVDIICHGSPSPKLWREYAELIEARHNGRITYLTFKDKRHGWNSPTAYVNINNAEVSISNYVKLFYSKCSLRPSCHKCPYATISRKVDMTIGDFWGIDKVMPEFYSRNGNSLVLIHNEIGAGVFDDIKGCLEYKLSNSNDCKQPNLIRPTSASEKRERFWQDYSAGGVKKIVKKYTRVSIKEKLRKKLIKIKSVFSKKYHNIYK